MKKTILLLSLIASFLPVFGQKHTAAFNFGIEAGSDFLSGIAGMSPMDNADNPLVGGDYFNRKYEIEGGFYAEYLHLHHRKKLNSWGNSINPDFGIKFNPNWTYFHADNSGQPNGTLATQYVGLNYANFPIVFEYCLGYKQGVSTSSYTPGTTTYHSEYDGLDNSVTTTATNTPGQYNPGGEPVSKGFFIYIGPKISYLFKSDNYTGNPINDPNLKKTYMGVTGGMTLEFRAVNLDLSYQKGLTSIYSGKNVMVNGFLLRIGINFGRRLYN
jgi:hypothetical protein